MVYNLWYALIIFIGFSDRAEYPKHSCPIHILNSFCGLILYLSIIFRHSFFISWSLSNIRVFLARLLIWVPASVPNIGR